VRFGSLTKNSPERATPNHSITFSKVVGKLPTTAG
jgi:hypothetical protein